MAAQESLLTLVDFGNAFLSNRRTEAAGGSNSGLSFFCWGAGGLLVGGAVGFVVDSICCEVILFEVLLCYCYCYSCSVSLCCHCQ